MVIVNNCSGSDQFHIRATVNNNIGIISSQETMDFTNTNIKFENIHPATYNCSISIMNGSQVIENMNISCAGTYVVSVVFIFVHACVSYFVDVVFSDV